MKAPEFETKGIVIENKSIRRYVAVFSSFTFLVDTFQAVNFNPKPKTLKQINT